MAITVKYLEGLGIEKETAEKIFAERGAEIEKDKAKLTAVETELKEQKEAFDNLNSEFETLKATNANGEEWKAKFDALQSEIETKAKQAEAERISKEKAEAIEKRFNAVVGDKKFSHEAIRAAYLKKFTEALESKDFEGKGDSDIFKELTQNDGTAFKGAIQVPLSGGTPRPTGREVPTKDEFKKMSYRQKLELFNSNKELYNELKE